MAFGMDLDDFRLVVIEHLMIIILTPPGAVVIINSQWKLIENQFNDKENDIKEIEGLNNDVLKLEQLKNEKLIGIDLEYKLSYGRVNQPCIL